MARFLSSSGGAERPVRPYSGALQHERTALAWERTAFSMMGIGVVLARFASVEGLDLIAFVGLLVVAVGVGLILWASIHYEARHDALRREEDIAHPAAARFVGIAATAVSLLCLGTAIVATT
jgi:uncharacterized membrane protein YidH (DUF202 family)